MKFIEATVEKPEGGKLTEVVDVAGPAVTVLLNLTCGVTIALGVGTLGIPSFCAAVVTGGTLAAKVYDKRRKQAGAKKCMQKLNEAEEKNVSSYLNCLVKDVAKELSRIFEYQLYHLMNEEKVKILAECAVDLLFDLKKDDTFDRNTLLRKVLIDGEAKKRKLLTFNDEKWSAPNVFRKPGLRQITRNNTKGTYIAYCVKHDGSCDVNKYGCRGQFLEMKEYDVEKEEATSERAGEFDEREKFEGFCEKCLDCSSSGTYFAESDIDGNYLKECRHACTYRPLYLLVQCPKVLHSYIDNIHKNTSFADFLKAKFGFQDNEILLSVYRQHVPGNVVLDCSQASEVLELTGANFTGSDFSYSDFANSSFLRCDFTNCVMIFAKLTEARMSGSKFLDTVISHSDLREVKADGCSWTKMSVLHSRVDKANLGRVIPTVAGNDWDGTNLGDAIVAEQAAPLNLNGSKFIFTAIDFFHHYLMTCLCHSLVA